MYNLRRSDSLANFMIDKNKTMSNEMPILGRLFKMVSSEHYKNICH